MVRERLEAKAICGTKIAGRLREPVTDEYFCGISNEELIKLFLNPGHFLAFRRIVLYHIMW